MPWKDWIMSEQRLVLVHRVVLLGHALSQVAREMGVSRKTAYKWMGRYRADPQSELSDRSRRPLGSPRRVDEAIEKSVLQWRDKHRWGARKIHRSMRKQESVPALPSMRTIATILKRHGRVEDHRHPPEAPAHQRFERDAPNQLWQLDHKGPLEIARRKYCPLVIVDDHSRYCLKLEPMADKSVLAAWNVLWDLFGQVGLPESILCDNAFSARIGLSWFDAQLVRLNIRPVHGRAYHPQTQGKVERLNGTIHRELITFGARRDCLAHFREDGEQWRRSYNTLRPHESLGDEPPVSRWTVSQRPRPASLPVIEYPADAMLRKVTQVGDVYYHGRRILVGQCLARQFVRIEEREEDLAVYYGPKRIRVLGYNELGPARSYKRL